MAEDFGVGTATLVRCFLRVEQGGAVGHLPRAEIGECAAEGGRVVGRDLRRGGRCGRSWCGRCRSRSGHRCWRGSRRGCGRRVREGASNFSVTGSALAQNQNVLLITWIIDLSGIGADAALSIRDAVRISDDGDCFRAIRVRKDVLRRNRAAVGCAVAERRGVARIITLSAVVAGGAFGIISAASGDRLDLSARREGRCGLGSWGRSGLRSGRSLRRGCRSCGSDGCRFRRCCCCC